MSQVVPLPPICLDTAGGSDSDSSFQQSPEEQDWDAWRRDSQAWAVEQSRQDVLGELAKRTPEPKSQVSSLQAIEAPPQPS